MKRLITFLTIILCVILTGCNPVDAEEKLEVTATVTDMQYKDSYITMMPVYTGEFVTFVSQTHPAQYLVTICYEDVSETFNNKSLYERVKKDDTLQMILYKGYDKDNNLIKQYLSLPE